MWLRVWSRLAWSHLAFHQIIPVSLSAALGIIKLLLAPHSLQFRESRLSSVMLMVGLHDLKGIFQPKQFYYFKFLNLSKE